MSVITQLLSSKTESDIIAALQFFPIATSFQVTNVRSGLRKMLPLVWGASPAILKELIVAVRKLYFCVPNESTFLPPNRVASNLVRLIQGATLAETTSFAELVPHLVGEGLFERRVLDGLWGYVTAADVTYANVAKEKGMNRSGAARCIFYRWRSRRLSLWLHRFWAESWNCGNRFVWKSRKKRNTFL